VRTTIESIVSSLAAWRGQHLRRAWRPVISSEQYGWQTVGAQFGGVPLLKPDEDWPRCPGCGRGMNLMIQLDLARMPPGLYPLSEGVLQYFQCAQPGCPAEEESAAAFNSSQLLRIIANAGLHTPKVPADVTPHPTRVVARWVVLWDLPSPEEHERLGLTYTYGFSPGMTKTTVAWPDGHVNTTPPIEEPADGSAGLAESIAQAADGDKLGGWPRWVQSVELPRCPQCDREMQYLMQLDWHDNIPDTFGDLGTGHITFCPLHPEKLAFAYQCS
jgi:hypothetical protein